MNVSSRTPEGRQHTCDICGYEFRMSSTSAGDACCPICNSLVWPEGRDESERKKKARANDALIRKKKCRK